MEVADDSIIRSEAFVALVAPGIATSDPAIGPGDRRDHSSVCEE